MDGDSLSHTKWNCKYHIVFAPKYRRQVIYKDIKADVGQILGVLCRRKEAAGECGVWGILIFYS